MYIMITVSGKNKYYLSHFLNEEEIVMINMATTKLRRKLMYNYFMNNTELRRFYNIPGFEIPQNSDLYNLVIAFKEANDIQPNIFDV